MSNSREEINWKIITHQVWHKVLQIMVEMRFFRLDHIDGYYNDTNDVDLVYQVRNGHQWYILMRKRKCWLSMTMWYLQILQDNVEVLYNIYMVMNYQYPMSHFELICPPPPGLDRYCLLFSR